MVLLADTDTILNGVKIKYGYLRNKDHRFFPKILDCYKNATDDALKDKWYSFDKVNSN